MKFLIILFIFFSNTAFGQIKNKEELKNISEEILSIIKKESIVTDSINWKDFSQEISNEVSKVNNMDSSVHIIYKIMDVLRKYGDYHSFYYDKTKSEELFSKDTTDILPTSKIVDNSIGYIKLPTHMSMNKSDNLNYAETLRNQIEFLDTHYKVKGWIIDLRLNEGGNMWPMLAGLNPLMNDGVVGYFVTNKNKFKWTSNSKKPMNLSGMKNTYKCENINNKIAVLIDTLTASSGEMTAISILGQKNTKSFGRYSGGYTTANGTYKLSNGAYLFLADSYCEDRTYKKYLGKIKPDVEVLDDLNIMNIAKKWIVEN